MLVVLFLFAGLATDAGILEWRYLQMSMAARAAAVGGAMNLQRGGSSTTINSAALSAAALNGFNNGVNGVAVSVQNPPSAGMYAGNNSSVRATISQSVPTAFMGLVGFPQVLMTALFDQPGAVSVSLSSAFNINAIFTDATSVTNGGFDTAKYAFSATALGSIRASSNLGALVSWRGNLFFLGPPNVVNGASQNTLTLTQGNFSQLLMLASTAYGPITTQFVVTYTDGSTASTTLSLSDWCHYNSYTNEVLVQQTPYRLYNTSGPSYGGSCNIYGYTISLSNNKVVKSLTLPNKRNVVAFAVDLTP